LINTTMLRFGPLPFPRFFYEMCLDFFVIVQYWSPALGGPARGRAFEQLFYRYCINRKLGLWERAGSCTLCGEHSASGFAHEQDAVVSTPEITIHVEMKHLGEPLEKNELLVFSHKGLDFILGSSSKLRSRPMFRVVLSGSMLRQEARRFALQWGIIAIEPERLPLPLLQYLSYTDLECLRTDEAMEVRQALGEVLSPVQNVISKFSKSLSGTISSRTTLWSDRVLNLMQVDWGDRYWAQLDRQTDNTWLEDRYDALDQELCLDQI
jgi:hypothetical protein